MNNEKELKAIRELRTQARLYRDVGMKQLMHAAYRSARMKLRELQCRWDVAPCLCDACRNNETVH